MMTANTKSFSPLLFYHPYSNQSSLNYDYFNHHLATHTICVHLLHYLIYVKIFRRIVFLTFATYIETQTDESDDN